MEPNTSSGILTFVPFILLSLPVPVIAYFLAREKGRRVVLWTVLGSIPFLNFIFIWYFMGASNLRLEAKVDHILSLLDRGRVGGAN